MRQISFSLSLRRAITVLGAVAGLCFLFAASQPTAAAEKVLAVHSLGSPTAKVVVDEYASLTCSHCAEFFVDTLPKLEKKYIDTGHVRFVFHDFPLDGYALKASAVAYCMPPEQFFPFVTILYKNLATWVLSKTPDDVIIQYAKLGGLDEATGRTCMKDSRLLDAIVAERTNANDKFQINATPTFIFNGGEEKLVGARDIKDFEQTIDRLVAEKKK